jgi:hypothetical protein
VPTLPLRTFLHRHERNSVVERDYAS